MLTQPAPGRYRPARCRRAARAPARGRAAWLALAALIAVLIAVAAPLGWAVVAIEALGRVLLTYFFYLFPDGRFVPRWTRWPTPIWVVGTTFHDALPLVFGYSPTVGRITSLFFDAWMLSLVVAQLERYRRAASPTQRQQVKWIMLGVAVGVGGFALADILRLVAMAATDLPLTFLPVARWTIFYGLMPFVPLAFGMAILRAATRSTSSSTARSSTVP